MTKFWRVCWYEYLRHVLRKRFILTVLSMPLAIVVAGLISVLAITLQFNRAPVGYVDKSGWLNNPQMPDPQEPSLISVRLLPFANEDAAQEALDQNKIQAYYVIPQDYLATGIVRQVSQEVPNDNVQTSFRKFLRLNLLAGQPPAVATRLLQGNNLEVRALDMSRQMDVNQWWKIFIPLASAIMLMLAISTTGGYLLQAVVEEKENRTIEIIVTSVSPTQLMIGKIVGNLSVGLTQILIWFAFPLAGFLALRGAVPGLNAITLEPLFVAVTVLTLVPAFILDAALMAMTGATAIESREAQQVSSLFTLPLAFSFWFITPLMTNPNGPLSLGLSLFPLTAPVALPIRVAFTNVPLWQIGLSVGLLVACAAGALWLAGRAFRLGLLRYGKRLSWLELFGVDRLNLRLGRKTG